MVLERGVLRGRFFSTFATLTLFWVFGTQALATPSESESAPLTDLLGVTYFSYFNGPGLTDSTSDFCPNHLGRASNNGINVQNNISLRWKFSRKLALDFQARFYLVFNNSQDNEKFSAFRWDSPRIGISGKLLAGDDWSISGAVNTEFPYFFPEPFSGYQVKERTVIFSPGMFAKFEYQPKNSRWSVFSVLTPRFFLYADRNKADVENSHSGFLAGNKPELILSFSPTLNYKLDAKWKLTLGTVLDYRKHVLSEWNPFVASLVTNGPGAAWRLSAVPISFGVTYEVSEQLKIYPYITAFPIAAQRWDDSKNRRASFAETISFGMWISGTLF